MWTVEVGVGRTRHSAAGSQHPGYDSGSDAGKTRARC